MFSAGSPPLPRAHAALAALDGPVREAVWRAYREGGPVVLVPGEDVPLGEVRLPPGSAAGTGVRCRISGRPRREHDRTTVQLVGEERLRIIRIEPSLGGPRAVTDPIAEHGRVADADQRGIADLYGQIAGEMFDRGAVPPYEPEEIVRRSGSQVGAVVDALAASLPLASLERRAILAERDIGTRGRVLLQALSQILERMRTGAWTPPDEGGAVDMERLRAEERRVQADLGRLLPPDTDEAKVAQARLSLEAESAARECLERIARMPAGAPEIGALRTYLDWVLALPWVTPERGAVPDLTALRARLDTEHHGLDHVKEAVLDLAVRDQERAGRNEILCLIGPPGVGKTGIARSIAAALGRRFVRISLGGVRDEADIRGHRRTYVGALPGRIVHALREAGTLDAVVLLDEVDKLGRDGTGDAAAALLEILDPEQNRSFRDHYLEVPVDLSRVLFIATANDPDLIPGPLADRLERITIDGYTEPERVAIAGRHLIPRLRSALGLADGAFAPDDATLAFLIRGYTSEAGVRELDQRLRTLATKILRARHSGEMLPAVDQGFVLEHLGPSHDRQGTDTARPVCGSATALAYSGRGGESFPVQVALFDPLGGPPTIECTGSLGEVLRESIAVARNHLRANSERYGLDPERLHQSIHVHLPSGAVPKDGASAGLALAAALRSALSGTPVRQDVGVTGEIDAHGNVLPVGGLAQKLLGARHGGCRTVVVPAGNDADIAALPDAVRDGLEIVAVSTLEEAWEHLLPEERAA